MEYGAEGEMRCLDWPETGDWAEHYSSGRRRSSRTAEAYDDGASAAWNNQLAGPTGIMVFCCPNITAKTAMFLF